MLAIPLTSGLGRESERPFAPLTGTLGGYRTPCVPEHRMHQHDAHHQPHDKHAGHDPAMFRQRFWLSLALTLPIVATSGMVMDWFGYSLDFPGIAWVGPVLGSVVFLYGGWPFLAGGVARDPRPRAGHDAAHLDGDHRRLCRLARHQRGPVRSRLLVGAGRARHHHAAGPLAGDEGDRPGAGRACRPRGAAARRRRARHPHGAWRASPSTNCVPATSYSSVRAPGSPPTAASSRGRPRSTSR